MLRLADLRSGFDIREFPEVCVDDFIRALADEEFAIALDDEGDEAAFGGSRAFGEIGELLLQIFFLRDAEFLHWAGGAVGERGEQMSAPSSIRD